jgi:hypothetical protein
LLLGTGFKNEYPFFDAIEHERLGLSQPSSSTGEQQVWQQLSDEADREIVAKFPILKDSPGYERSPDVTPFRLYNAIAPIGDHTIAFVGCVSLVNIPSYHHKGTNWAARLYSQCLR